MLSYHLRLGLPRGLSFKEFQIKILFICYLSQKCYLRRVPILP
jgi:hypothetical protein